MPHCASPIRRCTSRPRSLSPRRPCRRATHGGARDRQRRRVRHIVVPAATRGHGSVGVSGGQRRLRLLSLLVGVDGEIGTRRLCDVSASVTAASGAGIMLMSGDVPRGSLCTTDAVSALIEALQYELGEGPCVDAY